MKRTRLNSGMEMGITRDKPLYTSPQKPVNVAAKSAKALRSKESLTRKAASPASRKWAIRPPDRALETMGMHELLGGRRKQGRRAIRRLPVDPPADRGRNY